MQKKFVMWRVLLLGVTCQQMVQHATQILESVGFEILVLGVADNPTDDAGLLDDAIGDDLNDVALGVLTVMLPVAFLPRGPGLLLCQRIELCYLSWRRAW